MIYFSVVKDCCESIESFSDFKPRIRGVGSFDSAEYVTTEDVGVGIIREIESLDFQSTGLAAIA